MAIVSDVYGMNTKQLVNWQMRKLVNLQMKTEWFTTPFFCSLFGSHNTLHNAQSLLTVNSENTVLNLPFVEDVVHPYFIGVGNENLSEMVLADQVKQLRGSFFVQFIENIV